MREENLSASDIAALRERGTVDDSRLIAECRGRRRLGYHSRRVIADRFAKDPR
jgi:hypothetical protein